MAMDGYDYVAGPSSIDLSFIGALRLAGEKAANEGRPASVFVKPGSTNRGNYRWDVYDCPPNVNVFAPNFAEGPVLDGKLIFTEAGRRSFQGISIDNKNGKGVLSVQAAGVTLLARQCFFDTNSTDEPTAEMVANGSMLVSGTQFSGTVGNPRSIIEQSAGTVSIQNNSFASHSDFDTPTFLVSGGSFFFRNSAMFNPVQVDGGLMLLYNVEIDAFQVGRNGWFANIGNGGVLRCTHCQIKGANGTPNPVFNGVAGGTLQRGDVTLPDFTTGVITAPALAETVYEVARGVDA